MAKNLKDILFRFTKTARREINEFGERSAIGEAAAQNWRVYEKLLEAAGLMGEFEIYEKGPAHTYEEWLKSERSVTLTNAEWADLTTYLLVTTKYREEKLDFWTSLAEEKNPDGSPAVANAAKNAEYWRAKITNIAHIRAVIDGDA